MRSPTRPVDPLASAPVFVTVTAPAAAIGVTRFAEPEGRTPPSSSAALTVAVLATDPASTSVCFSVYVAVAVTDCPGVSTPVVPGHAPKVIAESPTSGSLITMSRNVD
ncbi:hypothetical protein MRBLWO14_003555 [Microbacterium sp. LWO14-1.2]|uniref:hypothetical protein n=1 Tax=Microbacterium sp. LWO14-1.2 TaxID=3135263 RepID=UPI003138DE0A